ncbi:hypothetical protein [Streptomyces sp. NPDC014733]
MTCATTREKAGTGARAAGPWAAVRNGGDTNPLIRPFVESATVAYRR